MTDPIERGLSRVLPQTGNRNFDEYMSREVEPLLQAMRAMLNEKSWNFDSTSSGYTWDLDQFGFLYLDVGASITLSVTASDLTKLRPGRKYYAILRDTSGSGVTVGLSSDFDGSAIRVAPSAIEARTFVVKDDNLSSSPTLIEVSNMSQYPDTILSTQIARTAGLNTENYNYTVNHKFGRDNSVGTTYAPVSIGSIYRTPTPSNATTLRIKAGGNANDTAGGSGAREVTLEGLDAEGNLITETLATAGASASASTSQSFMRLFRFFVSDSGTYATSGAGSHSGDIVIENTAGTEDWGTISSTDYPRAQSQIGVYTVPLGYEAFVTDFELSGNSSNALSFALFQRQNILDETVGVSAARVVQEFDTISGAAFYSFPVPFRFPALTDVGFMAEGAAGPRASVSFTILLAQAL